MTPRAVPPPAPLSSGRRRPLFSVQSLARNSTQKIFAECWGKKKNKSLERLGGGSLRARERHKFTHTKKKKKRLSLSFQRCLVAFEIACRLDDRITEQRVPRSHGLTATTRRTRASGPGGVIDMLTLCHLGSHFPLKGHKLWACFPEGHRRKQYLFVPLLCYVPQG